MDEARQQMLDDMQYLDIQSNDEHMLKTQKEPLSQEDELLFIEL